MVHPGCNACLGTGVVSWLNYGDLFQQAVDFSKGLNSRIAIFKALFEHTRCPKAKQDIEKFVRVTAQERACEHSNMLGGCSQGAQSVALGGVSSLQLVNFISNGVIEEAIHIRANHVIPIGAKRSRCNIVGTRSSVPNCI